MIAATIADSAAAQAFKSRLPGAARACPSRRRRTIKADEQPLPGVLEEIEEIAGRVTAIRLALAWGGREVHFPKSDYMAHHPEHPLARLLEGEGTVLKISDYLGGGSVYLPRARRACALYLAACGATPGEIATRLALSPSAARRYIRGAP